MCGLGRPATGAESGGPRVINFRSSEAAGTCITYYNTQLDTIIKAALRATMYLNARNRFTSPPIRSDTILFNCPEPGILASIRSLVFPVVLAGGD